MRMPFGHPSATTKQKTSASKLGAAGALALLATVLPSVVHGQETVVHGQKTVETQAANAVGGRRTTHATTPLSFVRNAGQDTTAAQFLAHGPGYSMRLSPGSVELSLLRGAARQKPDAAHSDRDRPEVARLGMSFAGANADAKLEAAEPLPGIESYFIGSDQKNWHTGLPTYAKLRYREIYPGIDLAFHGNESPGSNRGDGKLEYDIELQPHADSSRIAIELSHAERAVLDKDGNLELSVGGSSLRFLKPVAWQGAESGTGRQPVEVNYRLKQAKDGSPAVLSFETGKYDHARALVIDPALDYATYLNLSFENELAVDLNGNVYVSGGDPANGSTAFDVLKFNSAGTLVYTAVVQANTSGSYGYGFVSGLAVDANGDAFIAARAGPGWPTTSNAYQPENGYNGNSNSAFAYNDISRKT